MVNLRASPACAGEESTEILPRVLFNYQDHFITTDVLISEAKLTGWDAICYLDQLVQLQKQVFRHERSSSCSFGSMSFETAWHPLCSGSWYQEQAGKGWLWVADGKWRKKSGKSPVSARPSYTQAPLTPLPPAKARSVSAVTRTIVAPSWDRCFRSLCPNTGKWILCLGSKAFSGIQNALFARCHGKELPPQGGRGNKKFSHRKCNTEKLVHFKLGIQNNPSLGWVNSPVAWLGGDEHSQHEWMNERFCISGQT